ncbi:GntR family transcriptional regulator [Dactylosporangium sp. NPDC005572]|uniref:GntR family transcriptional regulator n=1 Tax=Dactylosporangium sp. NPDC005572 TaxID=3156889 RepID=UPI0033AABDB6
MSRPLDPSTGVPLHMQVEEDLRRRIEAREWVPGERIPGEEHLGEAYGVSRITMRQAIGRLVSRGLLVRERGRGTFVRDTALVAGARHVTSFTSELAQLGLVASAKVLDASLVPADEPNALALSIMEGEPMVRIHRLRSADGKPIGLQTSYLPAARFPGLLEVDLGDSSLYELLRRQYRITPVHAVETFTVGLIKGADARLLDVAPRTPGFFVERVTQDNLGPFERVTSVMRGDRYQIRFALRSP